ncbi:ARL14 effector protein isoform X2 [Drosophila mauritiana]|uniref:ARL14 effector protein isoform X2 n=1 Tax=Drosophila mauritiana TaxID=7226 RepID=A0A6P8JC06_DROMA|nr:ARL14 effector protein isoform X2 [Drosophila mauritiana]
MHFSIRISRQDMKPYLDSDYSISRNLRQRHRKQGVSNEYSHHLDSENKKKGRKKCQNGAYDEYGNIRSNGMDICDCMNQECDGCWYNCRSCGSTRCGPQCRSNRKFFYEDITYDGKDLNIQNKYISR